MTDYERAEGRLTILERQAEDLKNRMKGLAKALRDNLFALDDVQNMNGNLIAVQAVEFGKLQEEYFVVLRHIRDAKKILGRT